MRRSPRSVIPDDKGTARYRASKRRSASVSLLFQGGMEVPGTPSARAWSAHSSVGRTWRNWVGAGARVERACHCHPPGPRDRFGNFSHTAARRAGVPRRKGSSVARIRRERLGERDQPAQVGEGQVVPARHRGAWAASPQHLAEEGVREPSTGQVAGMRQQRRRGRPVAAAQRSVTAAAVAGKDLLSVSGITAALARLQQRQAQLRRRPDLPWNGTVAEHAAPLLFLGIHARQLPRPGQARQPRIPAEGVQVGDQVKRLLSRQQRRAVEQPRVSRHRGIRHDVTRVPEVGHLPVRRLAAMLRARSGPMRRVPQSCGKSCSLSHA